MQEEALRRVGDKIRARRQALEWSQQQLADAAKTDASYIGQIENALRRPSLHVLSKIADALDLQLYELFLPPAGTSAAEERIVAELKPLLGKLSPKKKKALLRIAEILRNID